MEWLAPPPKGRSLTDVFHEVRLADDCRWMKINERYLFTMYRSPYSTFLPSDVRIMAEHPLDIYVLNG
ncbi:hypothetical protein OUZ56_021668 [Daphnia magna]|uniref:Uncharacterized protein n=1 Tax=Daphnia magna TaxID=35525 RepID=A0ABR0AUD1_9CRUS|nr:hypothetical protein OUZ56_021668 [Daphnia magna]